MLKKPIAIPLLLIGVAAGFMATATDWHDFKQMAARTAVSEEISKPGTKCPLSKAYADSLDLEVLSICSAYGLIAMEAARRYPASAQNVFALYGEDPLFQAVFERYGQMVVPVVGYFVENGSNRYRANAVLQGAVARVSRGQTPTWGAPSGEQMGLMAIQELDERGSEVLAEFEVVDGRVRRKSIEATVLGTKNLILGGIHKLEKQSGHAENHRPGKTTVAPHWMSPSWPAASDYLRRRRGSLRRPQVGALHALWPLMRRRSFEQSALSQSAR
ncbi:hypothetical protein ACVWXL_008818 [Bradyrhizobium sp. GM22.5]